MKRILGIDLGTTNSLIAYSDGNNVKIISDRDGQELLPSTVAFLNDKEYVVGKRAKELQKSIPQNTIFSSKRFMGKNKVEDKNNFPFNISLIDNQILFNIHDRSYTPFDIAARILFELKKRAECHFGDSIKECVITVPAYFNDNQRNETKVAAELAGLEVVKMINEPTAAALAYGLNRDKHSITAVYDLGGGTFDISILKLQDGIFEVLSTNGNTCLGGDDFDLNLIELMKTKLGLCQDQNYRINEYLRQFAEEVKKKLTDFEYTELTINYKNIIKNTKIRINRSEFNLAIEETLNRTMGPLKQALFDAKLTPKEIDNIVLVGGSTRIPYVKKFVSDYFRKDVYCDLDPDKAVAIGAAIQAGILSGEIERIVLLDLTPLSLGMETVGGVTEKFIMRNSKIPCSVTGTFTTSVDNQTAVSFHIVQGERELAKDNFSLGKFVLRNIKPMAAGLPRIDVKFQIDSNGILNVSAIDMRSGNQNNLQIKSMSALTDEKVEQMLRDAFSGAKNDMTERQRCDAITEAKAVILATKRALKENGDLISGKEQKILKLVIKDLNTLCKNEKNYNAIINKTDELDKKSQYFAKIIMDLSIKSALSEQNLADL